MDIKLKNGEKKMSNAKWVGLLTAAFAAALFVAFMPRFEQKAEEYYEAAGSEGVESEEFIEALIQSNFVFYKNVMDKNGSKIYAYPELYLTEALEEIPWQSGSRDGFDVEEELENYYFANYTLVDAEQAQSILGFYASQMEDRAQSVENSYVEDIKRNMDYYVLDRESGMSMKNTSLPIEELINGQDDGTAQDEALKDYVYYVIMDYDAAGNLQNIRTRGRDADKLLKTVQTVESEAGGLPLMERNEVERFALVDSETDMVGRILTVTQKKPASASFVYALTKEQKQAFQSRGAGSAYLGGNFGMAVMYNSYFRAGTVNVYVGFLAVIFAIVMLLALCKPVALQGSRERRIPCEVTVAAAGFFLPFGVEVMIYYMELAGSGRIRDWLADNFSLVLNSFEYNLLKTMASFIFFMILFGAAYFLCLEFSDVFRDRKQYFQKRCLCVRSWKWIRGFCRNNYRKLREEILGVDLGRDADKLLRKLVFMNFCLLTTACLFWAFGIFGILVYSVILYFALKKYIHTIQGQYAKLLKATNFIAQGKLNNTFEEDFGVFESYKEELYKVQDGFKNAVDEEVKSQKMKTELITNVSHDLKTPLTAIITYIDLLKEEDITKEERRKYLETLEQKALRLKVLIEDLFEVSKANSGTVKLEPVSVDICNLMRQVYLEYEDKMTEAGLQVRFSMPEKKIILYLDSQKTYRIFENLYTNIIKYAMPDTRVFITAKEGMDKEGIHIELKNISAQELTGNPQDLSERFVRGDAARNTEGSGLGLAIAKSFTELQGGRLRIETDGDLFKVVLDW